MIRPISRTSSSLNKRNASATRFSPLSSLVHVGVFFSSRHHLPTPQKHCSSDSNLISERQRVGTSLQVDKTNLFALIQRIDESHQWYLGREILLGRTGRAHRRNFPITLHDETQQQLLVGNA